MRARLPIDPTVWNCPFSTHFQSSKIELRKGRLCAKLQGIIAYRIFFLRGCIRGKFCPRHDEETNQHRPVEVPTRRSKTLSGRSGGPSHFLFEISARQIDDRLQENRAVSRKSSAPGEK